MLTAERYNKAGEFTDWQQLPTYLAAAKTILLAIDERQFIDASGNALKNG